MALLYNIDTYCQQRYIGACRGLAAGVIVAKTSVNRVVQAEPKRQRLLDAAMATFLQFGFRKTSMEEIARAANVSRQGLYLHFPTKEELFAVGVRRALDESLAGVNSVLARGTSIDEKLVGAFDEWVGRYTGVLNGDVADLKDACERLAGDLLREREAAFLAAVTKTVRASGLSAAYKDAGIGARELVETLYATAVGLKDQAPSREEFRARLGIAVRVLYAAR